MPVVQKLLSAFITISFPLVKSGGCFINFDRERPPLDDQMKWLRDAGFQDVKRFWTGDTRALFGGFKK